jgi:hypothetical protein
VRQFCIAFTKKNRMPQVARAFDDVRATTGLPRTDLDVVVCDIRKRLDARGIARRSCSAFPRLTARKHCVASRSASRDHHPGGAATYAVRAFCKRVGATMSGDSPQRVSGQVGPGLDGSKCAAGAWTAPA